MVPHGLKKQATLPGYGIQSPCQATANTKRLLLVLIISTVLPTMVPHGLKKQATLPEIGYQSPCQATANTKRLLFKRRAISTVRLRIHTLLMVIVALALQLHGVSSLLINFPHKEEENPSLSSQTTEPPLLSYL